MPRHKTSIENKLDDHITDLETVQNGIGYLLSGADFDKTLQHKIRITLC